VGDWARGNKHHIPTILTHAPRAVDHKSHIRLFIPLLHHAPAALVHGDRVASMNTALLFLWPLATCLRTALAYDTPDTTSLTTPPQYNAAYDNGTFGYYPVRTYATAEDLHSPQVNFLEWDAQCDDGSYYFMAPRGWSVPDPGPMILDSRGELVWAKHFDNNSGGQAYDFQVQTYLGQEYLTFWLGDDRVRGHGSGHYYMVCADRMRSHNYSMARVLTDHSSIPLTTPFIEWARPMACPPICTSSSLLHKALH